MNNRTKVMKLIACLAELLSARETGLASWHRACEDTYRALIRAAAEESDIVKAARVLIRARVLTGDALPADLDLLEDQIAAAGDPPYATSLEDDSWVERIRVELQGRST